MKILMKKNIGKKNIAGLSLVELMVSILIGIIVLAGLISVFDTTSTLSRTQNGLARIQENGRYAITSMKKNIEQTGYQYCMGESNKPTTVRVPKKIAWDFTDSTQLFNSISGVSAGWIDPAILIHGHECDDTGLCAPLLNSTGSDNSVTIPAIGVIDGARIAGTDVLTVRYLKGRGREIENIIISTGPSLVEVNYTVQEQTIHPTLDSQPAVGSDVILVDCSSNNTSPTVVSVVAPQSISKLTLAPNSTPPLSMSSGSFARVFDTASDFVTVTYYVLNNIIDGRSIPTLYKSVNGVSQPIVQGVDDFDVVYGVNVYNQATKQARMLYLTADAVQSLPSGSEAGCWSLPQLPSGAEFPIGTAFAFPANTSGCGWRSVVSVELHFLMNTIYNSSTQQVPFEYTPFGVGLKQTTDIDSSIPHYLMHRKEFSTSIVLKNIMH